MSPSRTEALSDRKVVTFMVTVFALGALFYAIGPLLGSMSRITQAQVPGSALMFVVPALVAAVLVWRTDGRRGVRRWLAAALRPPNAGRIGWLAAASMLMPLILVMSYLALRWTGAPLPHPDIGWFGVPLLVVVYLVAALGEELGWTSYATAPLLRRFGTLGAGLVIGLAWAVLHIVPYWQAGHSSMWIIWQCLFTVGFRVILVWLYVITRSLWIIVVCHAFYNVSWSTFPNAGSHYNPMVTALITTATASLMVAAWQQRPHTH